ncbi:hypothetical protein PV10_06366 [Exophiala mesophila]|uniref:Uncharacterized protein n=1 Tax=Exophiala mesophila TaxID=212818 RepID=A0A0D1WRT4_EXOME|nr:uncharacterized protein PV10_06366 [Exophiala mesophila]KIV91875.1 hypothetical protein PV10_06366 [Exophiala mesophila]
MSRSRDEELIREGFDDTYEPPNFDSDSDGGVRLDASPWNKSEPSGSRSQRDHQRGMGEESSRGKGNGRANSPSPQPRAHKSDDPEWIATLHERYSTKAIRERFADPDLWPPKSANNKEHRDAQILRKNASTKEDTRLADEARVHTTMGNLRAVNELRKQGIAVKHFTGDPENPYETTYRHPDRPDRLNRKDVDRWAE